MNKIKAIERAAESEVYPVLCRTGQGETFREWWVVLTREQLTSVWQGGPGGGVTNVEVNGKMFYRRT